jgi:hypothetical protein
VSSSTGASCRTPSLSPDLTRLSGGDEPIPDAITVNGLPVERRRRGARQVRRQGAPALRRRQRAVHVLAHRAGLTMDVVELHGTATHSLTVQQVTLNVAQRVSVVVDTAKLPAVTQFVPCASTPWRRCTRSTSRALRARVRQHEPGRAAEPDARRVAATRAGRRGAARPQHGRVHPDAHGPMNATETNLLDARPLVALPAPKPTHSMYMEVVFQQDATGVKRAYLNGISDQASMSATTPLVSTAAAGVSLHTSGLLAATAGPDNGLTPIKLDDKARYYLPHGAVVDLLINNTDARTRLVGARHLAVPGGGAQVQVGLRAPRRRLGPRLGPRSGLSQTRLPHRLWHMAAGLVATVVEAPETIPYFVRVPTRAPAGGVQRSAAQRSAAQRSAAQRSAAQRSSAHGRRSVRYLDRVAHDIEDSDGRRR